MSLRDRLASLLGLRSTSDQDGVDVNPPPALDELDVDPPEGAPEECPNCGDAVGDLVPPDVGQVRLGEHQHVCHIGTRSPSPLAGWRVVHR